MTNIGYNPTINEQEKPRLEVHILDFEEEIYGEEIEVSFIKYLREEKKFNSREELKNSLEELIKVCREHKNVLQ
jgi:riboflavin kinase/FMN adenylyltransferase